MIGETILDRTGVFMFFRKFCFLMCIAVLVTAPSWGQVERGTVTGVVTDPTGAVVTGANVSIRSVNTNLVTKTQTSSAGIYYLPSLPPGRYELRVEHSGFRPAIVSDIALGADLTATFNLTLQVGAIAEAIQVQ